MCNLSTCSINFIIVIIYSKTLFLLHLNFTIFKCIFYVLYFFYVRCILIWQIFHLILLSNLFPASYGVCTMCILQYCHFEQFRYSACYIHCHPLDFECVATNQPLLVTMFIRSNAFDTIPSRSHVHGK